MQILAYSRQKYAQLMVVTVAKNSFLAENFLYHSSIMLTVNCCKSHYFPSDWHIIYLYSWHILALARNRNNLVVKHCLLPFSCPVPWCTASDSELRNVPLPWNLVNKKMIHSNSFSSSLCWCPQTWTPHSRWGLRKAVEVLWKCERSEEITSLSLMFILLLMQPSILLVLPWPSACCRLTSCFLSTGTPQILLYRYSLKKFISQTEHISVIVTTQAQHLALASLSLIWFSLSPFSNLSRSLLMASLPSVVSEAWFHQQTCRDALSPTV